MVELIEFESAARIVPTARPVRGLILLVGKVGSSVLMTSGLRDALESAYRAFDDVPRPEQVERHGESILELLTSMPLRQLPPDVIGPYAGWAITTAGSARDYMDFLPRILEFGGLRPAIPRHGAGGDRDQTRVGRLDGMMVASSATGDPARV
jgi:hypothetical protein